MVTQQQIDTIIDAVVAELQRRGVESDRKDGSRGQVVI